MNATRSNPDGAEEARSAEHHDSKVDFEARCLKKQSGIFSGGGLDLSANFHSLCYDISTRRPQWLMVTAVQEVQVFRSFP